MRDTYFNNTSLYPVQTFDDNGNPKDYLELCNSKVTHTVHIIPHVKGNAPKAGEYVSLDKEQAVKVIAFLKKFILEG